MAELNKPNSNVNDGARAGRTAGWYILLLAWPVYAAAFLAFSRTMVKDAPDITNPQLLDIAHRYASFVGAALGLATFLVTGLVYLILRLFTKRGRRLMASLLTAAGYAVWLVFGYDLVYLEPRYAEVARVIITYLGKPMLYAAGAVTGLALVGVVVSVLTLILKRAK